MAVAKVERLARVRAMTASGQAKQVRLRSRLSLRDIAQAVGVDTSTVGRWERGERTPKGEPAGRYADLLDRLSRSSEQGDVAS